MYDKLTCRIRDRVEVSKHYSGRYGAPGMKREPKRKATPEEMAKQNHWKRCRDLRRLIEINFGPGDWHVTLTCAKDQRPTKEEAPKVIREFLGKLRAAYRKRGWDLKYVLSCEIGDRGAVHWHLIINNEHDQEADTAKLIREHWKKGRPYFSPLDESGEYGQLADYIVKEAGKRIDRGETIEKMSYSRSRNLKKPVEHRQKVRATAWKKEPTIPKGWEMIPGSLVNGKNPYTGLPYQRYVLRRKEAGDGRGQPLRDGNRKGTAPPDGRRHVPPGGADAEGNGHEKQHDNP